MTHVPRSRQLITTAAIVILAAGFLRGRAATQPPPPPPPPPASSSSGASQGTGAVSGVVLDVSTRTPLAHAFVFLKAESGAVPITATVTPVAKQAITDEKGRFVFTDLPAMEYSVRAAASGYLEAFYGGDPLRVSAPAHVVLANGDWFGHADVLLPPAGVIGGHVFDESGEPVVGVYVRVLPQLVIGGRAHLAAGKVTFTDDQGAYRIAGLAPGRYVVSVPSLQTSASGNIAAGGPFFTPIAAPGLQSNDEEFRVALVAHMPIPPPRSGGRALTYPTTFAPNQTGDGLAGIELKVGERRTVDVTLQPVAAVKVSGRVVGPSEGLAHLALRLIPTALQELGDGSETATAIVAADGRFQFPNVPAGNYMILSRRPSTQYGFVTDFLTEMHLPTPPGVGPTAGRVSSDLPGGPPGSTFDVFTPSGDASAYMIRSPLVVGDVDMTVDLRLQPLVTLTGTIVRDDGRSVGRLATNVAVEPVDGDAAVGAVTGFVDQASMDGSFRVSGIVPGTYIVRTSGLVTVKSITWNGRDYTDRPLELSNARNSDGMVITITDKRTQLAGIVTDLAPGVGGPQAATVLVFPAEPDLRVNVGISPRRLQATTPRSDGRYEFNQLPPGRYEVIAVPSGTLGDWRDPAFLAAAAARAATVTVDWNAPAQQDIRLETVR